MRFTQYFKTSSVEQLGNNVAVQWRFLLDVSDPVLAKFPDGSYVEDIAVFDCSEPRIAIAERSVITKAGDVLFHYKWADPRFLNLSIGGVVPPGSIGAWLRIIVCHDELITPLITKADLTSSHFLSLSSTINGDGDIFYLPLTNEMREGNFVTPIVLLKWRDDKALTDILLKGTVLDESLNFRYEAARLKFDCVDHKVSFLKSEYYDEAKRLVWVKVTDPSKEVLRSDVQDTSPYGVLLRIACGFNEAQK